MGRKQPNGPKAQPPLPPGAIPNSDHLGPSPAGLGRAAMLPDRGPPRPRAHHPQGERLGRAGGLACGREQKARWAGAHLVLEW